MSGIPVLLEARALRVLVVGGGEVATRKATLFAESGAAVRVVARAASDALVTLAREDRISLAERDFRAGDIGDAQLVIAATDDRATNAAVATAASEAHRLVNVVDRPAEGSVATMATHRAGDLVIGVSAGGVPGAARRVRDAIAARFDARYADAVTALHAVRAACLAGGDRVRWREASDELLGDDFCAAVESRTLHSRLSSWR